MKFAFAVVISVELLLVSCGPGVVDGTESIGRGYYLADTGGDGRAIEYHGDGQKPRIVIGARVEMYSKQGAIIVVARLPASVVMKDGSSEWQVSPVCEYWVIDTTTHMARVTTDEREYEVVHCNR